MPDGHRVVAARSAARAPAAEGHVPGAVELHWKADLQDPIERDVVDRATFERPMSERGIGNDTTLVLYGDRNNWFAAYAYWYAKLYGHRDVRIMDGGRQKWVDEGRELTTEIPAPFGRRYRASALNDSIRAYRGQVREALGLPGHALVDVRSPAEYAGELIAPPGYEQEGAQRAGHIPTAVSVLWATAVLEDGTFRGSTSSASSTAGRGSLPTSR